MFPPQLYALTPRDTGTRYARAWLRNWTTVATGAAVTESTTLTNDTGDLIILRNIQTIATPGAGRAVGRLRIEAMPQDGGVVYPIQYDSAASAADVIRTLNWQGEFLLPPKWRLISFAWFDVGAAGNSVGGTAFGWVIPVGTLNPT
jgi:hypothetical protein